jgi:hypothetical protein
VKVLYLSHRLPYAPNRGDRIRSFHLLEGLRAAADVHVVSLVHDDDEASHTGELAARGMTVTTARVGGPWRWVRAVAGLAGTTPVTHALLDAPDLAPAIAAAIARQRPDVVVALGSGMAKFALQPPLDAFPYVLDMVDVDSEKWRALVPVTAPPKSWIYRREARVLAAFEAVATSRAVTTLVVNDRECASLKALAPAADIRVLRMGIDLDDFAPVAAPPPSATVVFCGVMNTRRTEAGAVWLARGGRSSSPGAPTRGCSSWAASHRGRAGAGRPGHRSHRARAAYARLHVEGGSGRAAHTRAASRTKIARSRGGACRW